ncbi:MAG: aconitate hydratase AcnA [Thermoplasmata archaeon]
MTSRDPLGIRRSETLGVTPVTFWDPGRLAGVEPARWARRPRTVQVLLENFCRNFTEGADRDSLVALANGEAIRPETEFSFYPSRVLLQDFTGVPVLVDLAMLRDAAVRGGKPPASVNPQVPVDLVVDHSVQVDSFGSDQSLRINLDREYERNGERYRFLRWARQSFDRLRIVPPGNGIVHQVNLEHLATVVTEREVGGERQAFPDTLIGTDSHTTMVNGVSVLGWGVGGIEAEAVMLGEPYFLNRPEVVGVELVGALPEGATATDLVLTVTHRLRQKGVVDRFVEFVGPGVSELAVPDRATISNMCPEYGATSALFPIDEAVLAYLRGTGRPEALVRRVEWYARRLGLWGSRPADTVDFDDRLTIDLSDVVPTIAGPKNPEESLTLPAVPASFRASMAAYRAGRPAPAPPNGGRPYPSNDTLESVGAARPPAGGTGSGPLPESAVVIAAITSCTNTSNPRVMVGAGLVARKARALGLKVPAYVKTSLAPGSKVVTAYLERAGLMADLDALGFEVVGYGCTTCIGNSGPLPEAVARSIIEQDAYVAAVLSGNRNFEARIHNLVRANYLASPMLVVAYALAGRMDVDLPRDPIGTTPDGRPVYLKDLWPTSAEIRSVVERCLDPAMFVEKYRSIEVGDAHWESLAAPPPGAYPWDPRSSYLARPPFLDLPEPWRPRDGRLVRGARALAAFGDRISTDHISPAGEIAPDSPAGAFLKSRGVPPAEFNTYGSRRGHHEVMVRGTFANVRLRNELAAPREGGVTRHQPSGELLSIFDAAERYRAEGTPLLVLAGKSYGQGSSRDWAAKGPRLLGVGAVIAESFERIHRSNLVDMGVLPLLFEPGTGWKKLGLTGREQFELRLASPGTLRPSASVEVVATSDSGAVVRFPTTLAIHSATELRYYESGGVLPYVMGRRYLTEPSAR